MKRSGFSILSLLVLLGFSGCTGSDPRLTALLEGKAEHERHLVERGASVYRASCTQCHSPDPRKDSYLGPSVVGSSFELLEARVLRAEYPEGYHPKKDTRQMLSMPQLKSQLPALYSYLQAYQDLSLED